jgi:hypothetical protein
MHMVITGYANAKIALETSPDFWTCTIGYSKARTVFIQTSFCMICALYVRTMLVASLQIKLAMVGDSGVPTCGMKLLTVVSGFCMISNSCINSTKLPFPWKKLSMHWKKDLVVVKRWTPVSQEINAFADNTTMIKNTTNENVGA